MKAFTPIVLAAVLLTASSLYGATAIGQSRDFDLKARQLCAYDTMVAELRLTTEQTGKIERILKDMDAALDKWDKANSLQLASLREDEVDSRKNGDTATLLRTLNQFMVLAGQRRGLAEPFRKQIRGVLSTEQRAKWEGYLLSTKLVGRFQHVGLTDEQKTQVRTLCDGRGGAIADLRDRADREGVVRTESEVNTEVIDSVLTEEQRVKLRGRRPEPSSSDKGAKDLDLRDQKRDGKKKAADKGKGAQGRNKNKSDAQKKKELDARRRKDQDARRRKEQDARRKQEARNHKRQQDNRRRQSALRNRRQQELRRQAEQNKKKSKASNKSNPKKSSSKKSS